MWKFTDSTPATGPKTFRAEVRLTIGGKPVDAYFPIDGDTSSKNELIIDDISGVTESSFGADFEYTLSNITVGTGSVSPKTPIGNPAPTFDTSTPTGKFNQLAAQKGWTAPDSFISSNSDSPYYEQDPAKRPAAAIRYFISIVADAGTSSYSSTSPTQTYQNNAKNWDPQMLATGIDLLGDQAIKTIARRVNAGDIDQWFHGNGTYIVGTSPGQIPPGTDGSGDKLITDGYWERTSPSGDIIANDFVSSAQSVTVTIAASDGQFTTRRMRVWKPVH